MKKVLWILLIWLLALQSSVDAVTLRTLKWPVGSNIDNNSTTVVGDRSIFNIISLVNKYLWFAVGLACFGFMIWNGYKLIMARGDSKQMNAATKSLIWSALGLTVCILAHIIVNIAIRLFA